MVSEVKNESKNANAIIIGGSTTDEDVIEEQTTTEYLNKKIKQKRINLRL